MQELIDFLEKKGFTEKANSLKNGATSLDLHSKKIEDEGAKAIAEGLKTNNSITFLDLHRNQIGAEGTKAIGEWLKTNNSITQLCLHSNQIGDEGAKAIAEGLKTNPITYLVLENNQIGDEGAKAIGEWLKTNNSITQLYLSGNQIGDEGAKAIGEWLKTNNSITQLYLSGNQIGDEGAKAIAELLKTNNSITQLYLSGNQIGDEGAKAIAEGLKANTSITLLHLYNNQIREEKIKEINEYLQRNSELARENNPQAEALNAQGNSFCKDGKYDKAIEKYNEAIAIIKKPLYVKNKINAEKNYEKQQADLLARQQAELVAKQQAELEARQQVELVAKQQAELEAKQQAELEAKQKAELEAKQKQEEEQQQQFNKLISAIQENKVEEAKNLIQKINTQTLSKIDDDGNTILHYAAEKNIPELYELLTSKVAPEFVKIANKAGKTALELLTQIQEEKQKMAEYMARQQIIIQETMKLIAEGNDRITEKNDKGILILGKTGVGKSTLTYLLAGEELKVIEDNNDMFFKAVAPKENIVINRTAVSETNIPSKLIDGNGVAIWDCPGFMDTRKTAQEIANAFYIQKLCTTSKQLKFILAITEADLKNKTNILPIVKQFTEIFTDIEFLENSVSLVITKVSNKKNLGNIQKDFEKVIDTTQNNDNIPAKTKKMLEFLKKSIHIFHEPDEEIFVQNTEILNTINSSTEYVDLSTKSSSANISISKEPKECAKELFKITYNNINSLVDIFTKAISDPNKCMTNIDDNIFIKSYDVVESLPKASPSVKHAPFNRLPLHNDSIDPFLKLDQIKSLQKILFENLSNNNNSNSAKDNFLKVLEVFEEFIINDDELKQKIQNYAYVFKQQIGINECFSQVCGNKPVNYSHKLLIMKKNSRKFRKFF